MRVLAMGSALALSLLAGQEGTRSECAPNLFERVVEVLEERFYDAVFRRSVLPGLVDRHRIRAQDACSLAEQRAVTFELLREIPASHLTLLSGASYRRLLDELWSRPVPTLGFELAEVGGRRFAHNVMDGGPAAAAGLLSGDRIVAVDGVPVDSSARLDWRTDDAFLDDTPARGLLVAAGETVRLGIERRPGEPGSVSIVSRPYSLLRAFEASARVIRRSGVTVGYVHIWMVQLRGVADLLERILEGPLASAEALVLDLRGRGGSGAMVPRLLSVLDGARSRRGLGVVVLTDRDTRSAKEVLAWELRETGRAVLVGEPTAGAAIPAVFEDVGDDTYLMFPAFRYPRYTDLIELHPVTPHVPVARAGPYSGGTDPILEAGVDQAVRMASGQPSRGLLTGLRRGGRRVADEAPAPGGELAGRVSGAGPVVIGSRAEQGPGVRDVLARMVEALGGEAALRSHPSITQTGTFEIVGTPVTGAVAVRLAAPYRYLTMVDLEGMGRIVQGYDGTIGWSETPGEGRRVLDGTALGQLRNQANFFGPLTYLEHYDAVELVGRAEFDGRSCYELRLGYGEDRTTTQYVDTATFLIAGQRDLMEVAGSEIETTTYVRAYADFDGLELATEIVVDAGGIQQQRLVFTEASFEAHPPGTFEPPPWAKSGPGLDVGATIGGRGIKRQRTGRSLAGWFDVSRPGVRAGT